MPGLDGSSFVRIIRAEGGERELPILVLAGTVSAQARERLMRLGVNALMEKSAGSEDVIRKAVQLVAEVRADRLPVPPEEPKRTAVVGRMAPRRAGPE
jgi:CheY-like chemotaxis protein